MENVENKSWLPEIIFDIDKGQLEISGRSLPEDPSTVFEPLLQSVENYIQSPAPHTAITVNLDYINTSSVKWLFNILKQFELLYVNNQSVSITFVCPDETIMQTIRFFEIRLKIPIKTVTPDSITAD